MHRTIKQINELGGTRMDLRTWGGKWLLQRMGKMPVKNDVVHPLLGFVSIKDYMSFFKYHEEQIQ